MIKYLKLLKTKKAFSRGELLKEMRAEGYSLSEASFNSYLQQMLADGSLSRAGRNAYYVTPENLTKYSYNHSEEARGLASR